MSAPKRKRECYARLAVQLRTHERAFLAESICPGAMGMYAFLNLQARGEESWGDVSEVIAESSWGGPSAYRKKQIAALAEAGLVDVSNGKIRIVRYEEHNDTPDVIEANRSKARDRMAVVRANKPRTSEEQHHVVPSSSSISISRRESERDPEPSSARAGEAAAPPASGDAMPDWFRTAAEACVMSMGGDVPPDLPARWLTYRASRARKVWAMSHQDAVGWLADVLGRERRENASRPPPRGSNGPSSAPVPISRARQYVSNEPSWKQQR